MGRNKSDHPKKKMCICVDESTEQRLRLAAEVNHSTVSQVVTTWAWYGPGVDGRNGFKKELTVLLSSDTKDRLFQYCWEQHMEVDKALTDIIWKLKVDTKNNMRGQMSLEDMM